MDPAQGRVASAQNVPWLRALALAVDGVGGDFEEFCQPGLGVGAGSMASSTSPMRLAPPRSQTVRSSALWRPGLD